MFFHIVLERKMQLHPRYFGCNIRDNLVSKLMKDVKGTCSGRHKFVVAVTGIENIGKGLIHDGTGFVTFPMGFFAEAGPVQIFVSNQLIPDDMEFQSGDLPNYTTSDGSVYLIYNFLNGKEESKLFSFFFCLVFFYDYLYY
uniref:DNA-directed RNA polymerase subunit n=1 Tax=Glycine max TaxID=3847 RepID=A0A0R0GFZ9_SOYBN